MLADCVWSGNSELCGMCSVLGVFSAGSEFCCWFFGGGTGERKLLIDLVYLSGAIYFFLELRCAGVGWDRNMH